MRHPYIKPTTEEIEITVETMLAMSTDRIPVGDGTKPPAVRGRRGTWGDLWADGIDE